MFRNFCLGVGLVFLVSTSFAQDRGTIRGTVTDETNAAIPDAGVTARNVNTGLVQTVRTSPDGVYTILYLPVGTYTVTTEKAGFRKAEAVDIRVAVNTVKSAWI